MTFKKYAVFMSAKMIGDREPHHAAQAFDSRQRE